MKPDGGGMGQSARILVAYRQNFVARMQTGFFGSRPGRNLPHKNLCEIFFI
jgi:hypothetical protein